MERLQAAPIREIDPHRTRRYECLSVQRGGARQPVKNRTGCACFQWLGPGMKCGVNFQRSGAENLNAAGDGIGFDVVTKPHLYSRFTKGERTW